jgi:hypothetical protein
MSYKSYLIFACSDVKHKYRRVDLEDYLTYRLRVMLVKFGTRVRVSHNILHTLHSQNTAIKLALQLDPV